MHLPEAEIRRILDPVKLVRRTARTITSMDELLADLREAGRRGYALDDAEDEAEGRGVAAAVWGSDGRVIASMGLAGTLQQLDPRRVDGLGKLTKNYSLQLSKRLGFHPDEAPADETQD
jgi:DNA-binding IclR family transcriptional regulator